MKYSRFSPQIYILILTKAILLSLFYYYSGQGLKIKAQLMVNTKSCAQKFYTCHHQMPSINPAIE